MLLILGISIGGVFFLASFIFLAHFIYIARLLLGRSPFVFVVLIFFLLCNRWEIQYLLVFIASVLVIDAFVGEKGLLEIVKKGQEYRALEQSLTDARAENARLRDDARRLREDPDAIEEIARRQLGLIKPGEKLFIIKDVAPADR